MVNVIDMERGVAFWCAALGYELREASLDPDFVMLQQPDAHGIPVSLQRADREAVAVEDWSYPPNPDFVVLRDPDGNEFCVTAHHDDLE